MDINEEARMVMGKAFSERPSTSWATELGATRAKQDEIERHEFQRQQRRREVCEAESLNMLQSLYQEVSAAITAYNKQIPDGKKHFTLENDNIGFRVRKQHYPSVVIIINIPSGTCCISATTVCQSSWEASEAKSESKFCLDINSDESLYIKHNGDVLTVAQAVEKMLTPGILKS